MLSKRKVWKIFDFIKFCGTRTPMTGQFRENIKEFLAEHGELQEYTINGCGVWCTSLQLEEHTMTLYTVVEKLNSLGDDVYAASCDTCRKFGWSGAGKTVNYHLIMPQQPLEDLFKLETNHLLYGVIHRDGTGHLMCINGFEGGSKIARGRQLMSLWDRICSILKPSQVTVDRVPNKLQMDLSLLHGIAYGDPWYAKWGYVLWEGSLVTRGQYKRKVSLLRNLKLDGIEDCTERANWRRLKQVIQQYRDLSEGPLNNLQDLICFMLAVKTNSAARDSVYQDIDFMYNLIVKSQSGKIISAVSVVVAATEHVKWYSGGDPEVRVRVSCSFCSSKYIQKAMEGPLLCVSCSRKTTKSFWEALDQNDED